MRTRREHIAPRDHQKSERLIFIDEELFWIGEITRRSIEEAFGVSEETAKADLRDYRRGYAPDLKPDPRDNIYRVSTDFTPRLSNPDPERYLDRLARRAEAALPVATVPDVDRRAIDRTILQSIIRAIREICEIDILYRSPRSDVARRHRIFPYALLHDGFRWSVRCYIKPESHWGELVLDRIEEVFSQSWPSDPTLIGGDEEWQTVIELELLPNPALDAAGRSLIQEQYGMKEGSKIVRVRQCMLAYFLKRYHLEEPTTLKAPHQAPLRLKNRGMVMELLPPGMQVPLEETDALAPKLMHRLRGLLPEASEQAIMERALEALLVELTEENQHPRLHGSARRGPQNGRTSCT
jgi:predicted DNA-binding transcriptional regulator YafY